MGQAARQVGILAQRWIDLRDCVITGATRLPSLNALKALEAVARHAGRAGLCVMQGSVRQQMKAPEAELGCRLFSEQRRLVITAAGRS